MSDVQQGPGWWLASDGRWYPPELAPASPDGSLAPGGHATAARPASAWGWQAPAPSVNPGLATWLRILFLVMAGTCAVAALLYGWTLLAFGRFERTLSESAYDAWILPDRILDLFGFITWPVSIALLVLVIIWSWQAHAAATALGWNLRWRVGWTIGAWFIPCASLVLPKMVIGNIERLALARRRDGRALAMWHTNAGSPLGWVWWIAYVLYTFRVGFQVETSGDLTRDVADHGGSFTAFYVANLVASLFGVVAALAGAAYFRRMSDRLTPEGLAAHRDD